MNYLESTSIDNNVVVCQSLSRYLIDFGVVVIVWCKLTLPIRVEPAKHLKNGIKRGFLCNIFTILLYIII